MFVVSDRLLQDRGLLRLANRKKGERRVVCLFSNSVFLFFDVFLNRWAAIRVRTCIVIHNLTVCFVARWKGIVLFQAAHRNFCKRSSLWHRILSELPFAPNVVMLQTSTSKRKPAIAKCAKLEKELFGSKRLLLRLLLRSGSWLVCQSG